MPPQSRPSLPELTTHEESDIKVYPNPAKDILKVVIPKNKVDKQIEIYDLTGKQILTEIIKTDSKNVNISQLRTGMYFLRIKAADEQAKVFKFTVVK